MTSATKFENFFHVFRDINRAMARSTSLQEVLRVAVYKSSEVLNAKGALLRILNRDTNQFEVRAACGLAERYLTKGPVTTEKVLADLPDLYAVKIISDIWHAPRVEYPQAAWDEGIRMMVDVPLSVDAQMIGVIRIYLDRRREFYDDELDFMITMAKQCACIIERMRLMEEQKARFDHLVSRMDKMSSLGRMAAGIAHEINNPLAGILLYSSNMHKKVPPGGPLQEGLGIIIKETQRCRTIIQGLLEFARDREPQTALTDINQIMESALGIVENEFHIRHVALDRHLAADMISIMVDGNQIEQIFINLLLNALHAVAPHEGRVTVESEMNGKRDRIVVRIRDNGCGIAETDIKKIFEPFFSTKTKGTGLGLSVSYGIVQNHQGDIRVSSVPGQGTTFTVELPIRTVA